MSLIDTVQGYRLLRTKIRDVCCTKGTPVARGFLRSMRLSLRLRSILGRRGTDSIYLIFPGICNPCRTMSAIKNLVGNNLLVDVEKGCCEILYTRCRLQ